MRKAAMSKDEIFELIQRNTREVIPGLEAYAFRRSDRLSDLGANSVDRAEIIMMTMEAMSLQIPRVELFGAGNIGELADILHEKIQTS
jgi:polyketide biosynthesis acyl carrier protein